MCTCGKSYRYLLTNFFIKLEILETDLESMTLMQRDLPVAISLCPDHFTITGQTHIFNTNSQGLMTFCMVVDGCSE